MRDSLGAQQMEGGNRASGRQRKLSRKQAEAFGVGCLGEIVGCGTHMWDAVFLNVF